MYDAGTGAVSTIDGRETAPASADEGLFVEDGELLEDLEQGGLVVGQGFVVQASSSRPAGFEAQAWCTALPSSKPQNTVYP